MRVVKTQINIVCLAIFRTYLSINYKTFESFLQIVRYSIQHSYIVSEQDACLYLLILKES